MLTITQIEYILAVEKWKHFGKAAKECCISQPTLSMQLQKAESTLNIIIFDRSKSPILTTDEGKIIIEQCVKILFEYKKLFHVISEVRDEIAGDFRLGVIPTICPYVVPLFVESFCNEFPKVNLIIEEMKTEKIIESLSEDKIDAGLLVTPLYNDGIIEKVLFYEPLLGYISEKSKLKNRKRISPEELKRPGLLILNEGHCFRDQILNLCEYSENSSGENILENLSFESGSLDALKKVALISGGHTVLPYLATTDMNKDEKKRLVEIEGRTPTREVSLVYSRSFLKESIIIALEESIVNSLPSEVKSLKKKEIKIVEI